MPLRRFAPMLKAIGVNSQRQIQLAHNSKPLSINDQPRGETNRIMNGTVSSEDTGRSKIKAGHSGQGEGDKQDQSPNKKSGAPPIHRKRTKTGCLSELKSKPLRRMPQLVAFKAPFSDFRTDSLSQATDQMRRRQADVQQLH